MKRNFLGLTIWASLILLTVSNHAYAKSFTFNNKWNFKPYVGLEYQYTHIKPTFAYHSLLSANYQFGNIFLGTRVGKYFGAEIGYYQSLKNSQEQNDVFGFNEQLADALTGVGSNTKFKGFSIDLSLYKQLDPNFFVCGIVGLVTMHPTFNVFSNNNNALSNALKLVKAKNATVPRLGFGVDYEEKHWGMRSRIFWMYTQNMKMNVSAAQALFPAIPAEAWLQAVQATVGLYYRF